MWILCDRNVQQAYRNAFSRTDWITVAGVSAKLSRDASDREIDEFASEQGWIVFTEDHRSFPSEEYDCDVILYSQNDSPSPDDVIRALDEIRERYDDETRVVEYVGSWLAE